MDILELVDKLEQVLEDGRRVPFSGGRVAIDQNAFFGVVDTMRVTIPQEIRQAREIHDQRDRYIADAHEEARHIIAQARQDAARLLDEHTLRVQALAQAAEIIQEAKAEAERVRAGSDQYSEARLRELAHSVAQLHQVIQNGLQLIENRRPKGESPGAQGGPKGPGEGDKAK